MSLYTPKFRVSYPNVLEAKKNELSGKMQYSVVALFPKGTDFTEMREAAKKTIEEKWPNPATRPRNLRTPFRKHEERATEKEDGSLVFPAGMEEGGIFFNLTTNEKPGVVDFRPDPADPAKPRRITDKTEIYAGCYAKATVTVYAYDNMGNRGVAFGLQNLQKVADGEPISGRPKAEADFAPLADAGIGNAESGATSDDIFGL